MLGAAAGGSARAGGSPSRPGISGGPLRIPKFGLVVSAVLFAALITFSLLHVGDLRRFAGLLERAEPIWLLVALGAQVGTYLCAGAIWERVASAAGRRLPLRKLARLSIEKLSVDQFLPAGGMAGNVVVVTAMRRMGLPEAVATEALLIDILSHYGAFGSVAIGALFVLGLHHDVTPVVVVALTVFALLVASVPVAVWWLLRHRDWTPRGRLARLRAVGRVRSALEGVSPDRVWNRRLLGTAAALQLAVFFLDSATLWAVLRALGTAADPLTAFVAVVMAAIAATVSLLPGGIGSYEAACTTTLALLGLPFEAAIAGTLALRGLTLWVPLLPGIVLARRDLSDRARVDSEELASTGPPRRDARAALPDVYENLGSSRDGLGTAQAAARLAELGPNAFEEGGRETLVRRGLRSIASPLAIILLTASVASAALGQTTDAAIIAAMVLLSAAVNLWQSSRSERAVRSLQARVTPSATVLRDGSWSTIARRDLVPGDVIRLAAGDLVPADARLIEATDLQVQQAALTGESFPAEKRPTADALEGDEPASEALVFVGTTVVSGTATAIVFATGRATAFGDIAAHLATPPDETEFERGSRRFGMLILQTVVFLVLLVVIVSLAMGREPLQSLLFAVALAVGLTPEYLPMITTVTLAQGAVEMAKQKVIVKHLASIQNLGTMDVLCSDKTGTITSGTLTLHETLDPSGRRSDRVALLGHLNSAFQTGVRSPLDDAILDRPVVGADGFVKLGEIPFDFERRRLSVTVARGEERLLVTKGAPENVLAICRDIELDGSERRLDDDARARAMDLFRRLSESGFRVLAIGVRSLPPSEAVGRDAERDLVLAGFLSFREQVAPDAALALADLARDGVRVKILSGDNEVVTRAVCKRVGIGAARVVTGDEVARADDIALARLAEDVDVFARLIPAQKHRIVRALRTHGHVVGFMGDGINDAPSLHAADVGISVAGAVDIAREASDILLLEKRLGVLHAGVAAGRRSFANVFKYLLMGTSSNFGNVLSMAGAVFFLPFLPMLPTQILVNNFLYDLAQITIPTDRVDPELVRGPQRWDIGIIRSFMLRIGPISSIFDFLTFGVLLLVFRFGESAFQTGWFVESLATQVLVVFVIRTIGRPWSNRPSTPLTLTVVVVLLVALALPFVPAAASGLGMTPLPMAFFAFLAVVVPTYLALVEVVKGRVMAKLFHRAARAPCPPPRPGPRGSAGGRVEDAT